MNQIIVKITKYEPPGQTSVDNGFSSATPVVQVTPLDEGFADNLKDKWLATTIPEWKIAPEYGNILGKETIYGVLTITSLAVNEATAFLTEIIGPVAPENATETDEDRAGSHLLGQKNYDATL